MIISHGHLVASDTPENLAKLMEGENTLELTIKGSRTEVEGMLNAIPEIAEKNFTSNENGLVQKRSCENRRKRGHPGKDFLRLRGEPVPDPSYGEHPCFSGGYLP